MRWAVAPSAALVGRMRYAHKFVIVGLVLFVPLALVAGAYVHLQQGQIEFSVRERHGVDYLDPLASLTAVVIAARREAAEDASPPSAVAERWLAAVDAADTGHGTALGIVGHWPVVRTQVAAALSASGTPAHRVAVHNDAVDSLLALIVQVGDASNLTLDPDLDTYYLMDTVQFRLPVLLDALARVSDVAALGRLGDAAGLSSAYGGAADAQIRLGIARGVLSSSQAALVHNLDTVVARTRDAGVRDSIRGAAARLTQALAAYSRDLDDAVQLGRADRIDPAVAERLELVVTGTTDDALHALDRLLEQRIEGLSDRAQRVVAGTVLATVVAVYLFLGFYVSVVTSIGRIVTSLRAVAAGDLTQQVRVDTRDELRFVAEVLNETVSRTREATDLLTEQATIDALTRLPNRVLVLRQLEALRSAGARGWVLFIDLDRFKPVNDSYGHESGDEVLREVADRLSALVADRAQAGRLAGDEFVLLAGGDVDEVQIRQLGALVVQRLSEPFRLSRGRSVRIGASVGISAVVSEADGEELLRRADVAMYEAKKAGRGQVAVYGAALKGWPTRAERIASP